jgi:hypothetical protein
MFSLICLSNFWQYNLRWQKVSINTLIEEAVLEAEEKGVKVLSLGLLNQASTSRLKYNAF